MDFIIKPIALFIYEQHAKEIPSFYSTHIWICETTEV